MCLRKDSFYLFLISGQLQRCVYNWQNGNKKPFQIKTIRLHIHELENAHCFRHMESFRLFQRVCAIVKRLKCILLWICLFDFKSLISLIFSLVYCISLCYFQFAIAFRFYNKANQTGGVLKLLTSDKTKTYI